MHPKVHDMEIKDGTEQHWVCTVCLTNTNVSKPTEAAHSWLQRFLDSSHHSTVNLLPFEDKLLPSELSLISAEALSYGVCKMCAKVLHNVVRLVERAQRAQRILHSLRSSGDLNIKRLTKARTEEGLLIPLSTIHLGVNDYNYNFVYKEKITEEENHTIFLKEEEIEVKKEMWSDMDNTEDEEENLAVYRKRKLIESKKLIEPELVEPKKLRRPKRLTESKSITNKKTQKCIRNKKTVSEAKRIQMETDIKLQKHFNIEKLTLEEQKADVLKAKESKNYKNSYFKCESCFKGFADASAFERHKLKHTEAMGRHKCNLCQIYCSDLARHLNENHTFKFTCKKCNVVIKNRTSASSHAAFHEGKRFVCDVCGQVFSHKSTHLSHLRIKHPSEEHVCNLCGFSFINERGLRFHKTRQHRLLEAGVPADGPWCSECDIRFLNAVALSTHERVSPRHGTAVRNDSSRFPFAGSGWGCGRGHRRFPAQPRTRRGKKDSDEVIICEQCGEPQGSQQQYRTHLSSQHAGAAPPRPRLCTLCGHTFKSIQMLHNHAKCHTPRFECDVCHKRFTVPASLATHMNIHTGERVYPCQLCGKRFNHVANQRRHVATVHSQIRVQCEFCEKYFKSKYELEAHVRHVHLKVPYPKRNRKRRVPTKQAEEAS